MHGDGWVNGNGTIINTKDVLTDSKVEVAAHEIGHNLGLTHNDFGAGASNNLMTTGILRNQSASQLTAQQIAKLRESPFVLPAPVVRLDVSGDSPFGSDSFFRVSFDSGSPSTSLTSLTIDVSPLGLFFDPTDSPPGKAGSPLGFGFLNGLSENHISVAGAYDGSQRLTLNLTKGEFNPGDSFYFGVDMDYWADVDGFNPTSLDMVGMKIGYSFDFGLSVQTEMSSSLVSTSTSDVIALSPITAVPELSTAWLLLLGIGLGQSLLVTARRM